MTTVKFKVVELYPEVRGADVLYYTDEFPQGTKMHITFYLDPIPSGNELKRYILDRAPRDWLIVMSRCQKERPDMTPLEELLNVEVTEWVTHLSH